MTIRIRQAARVFGLAVRMVKVFPVAILEHGRFFLICDNMSPTSYSSKLSFNQADNVRSTQAPLTKLRVW